MVTVNKKGGLSFSGFVSPVIITATYNGPIWDKQQNEQQVSASGTFTITFTDDRVDPNLNFSSSSVSVTLGSNWTQPTLNQPATFHVDVTFDSSDKSVATVDGQGTVSIVGVGATTISASSPESDNVKAGYASYTLIVNDYASLADPPTAKTGLVYNRTEQELVNAGTAYNGTLQYKVGNGSYDTAIPTAIDAGTYTVYYMVVGDAYYDDVAEQSLQVTIDKATPTVTAPTAKEKLTYTGEAQELITAGTTTFGTLLYSVDGGEFSEAIPTGKDAKDYTITYKVVGTDNYNGMEASDPIIVTIAKATPTVTPPSAIEGLEYTGAPQALITAGEATGGELQYSTDGETFRPEIPTGEDAGTYYIYYKVEEGDNYEGWGPERIEVTIAKANATVTAPTGNTLNYTGQAQALVTGGEATGGTLEYSTDGKTYSTTVPTGTDVGEYTVYYRVTGDANHNDVAAASVKATIANSQSTVETAPVANTLTYTGQAQALITAGTATHGEMQYSTDGQTYSTTIPTATNAGTYDVWYQVKGSTGYNDVAAQKLTVTIQKANATVTFSATTASAKMGVTFTAPTATTTPAGLALTYASSDASVATVDASTGAVTLVAAGETTVTASFAGNDNLNAASASYVLTVAKKDRVEAELSFSANSCSFNYGDMPLIPTLNNPQNLPVTWSSSNTSVATVAADGTVTIGKPGETTITASFAGNDDYLPKSVSYTLGFKEGLTSLSFSSRDVSALIGETFTEPVLTSNPSGLTVTYSSSNTSVATVDATTGKVTLIAEGTTTITAEFAGNDYYSGSSDSYTLTVSGAEIAPITKEEDYSMIDPATFTNPDGKEKDLSNVVINNILYTLKNLDSHEGDGYDPDLKAIVLNTVQSSTMVDILVSSGLKPGSSLFATLFTGMTFKVPAGEGFIVVTSQEENGHSLMVKVGDNKPVAISMPEMGDYSIPYKSDVESWVFMWNGGILRHFAPTRGKKAMSAIKVTKVSYRSAATGIHAVGADSDSEARWYDLNGRRIEQPTKKGLYILNGRKVVVH